MDDPSGDTKSMNDMVFNEANQIAGFDFGQRYGLCPF